MTFLNIGFSRAFRSNFIGSATRLRLSNAVRCVSSIGEAEFSKGKVFLEVPFADKEEVKRLGARWDKDTKKWFVGEFLPLRDFQKWQTSTRTNLKVPFEGKDEVKALGARWDSDKKVWFVESGMPTEPFEKWIDQSAQAGPVNETFANLFHAQEAATELLFLKVDTTGFPKRVNFAMAPFDWLSDYDEARVIHISGLLCDRATFKPLDQLDITIRADDFTITSDRFHGISQEKSMSEGVPFADAAHSLATILESRPLILAHNAEFVLNVLKSELTRHHLAEALEVVEQTPALCMMQLTKPIIQLQDERGMNKNPSFKELYQYAMIAEQVDAGTKLGVHHLQEAVQKLVENDVLVI